MLFCLIVAAVAVLINKPFIHCQYLIIASRMCTRTFLFTSKFIKKCAFLFFTTVTSFSALPIRAKEAINLYPSAISNAKTATLKETISNGMFRSVITPTLEIYLSQKEKVAGVAVAVCRGGVYSQVIYQGIM